MRWSMEKVIRNVWRPGPGPGVEQTSILQPERGPEGLGAERLRVVAEGATWPLRREAQLLSVLRGALRLTVEGVQVNLQKGSHLYLPAGVARDPQAAQGTELAVVWAGTEAQARGTKALIRDEQFLSACAGEGRALRWILTPQYLSRRVFLHHDATLLSKAGQPVSWFHTTMFDVSGLPTNDEGEPVFKMSYNSKTEFNLCYETRGVAKVRMALHPYRQEGQSWGPWQALDGDTTYHLNEAKGGPEEESIVGEDGRPRPHRNKHEVTAKEGYVSLMCVFDPAPSGIERHRPGEYSDYEPIEQVLGTPAYEDHRRLLGPFDAMLDRLSWAKARGALEAERGSAHWRQYEQGRTAQRALEAALLAGLDLSRQRALEAWRVGPA